MKFSVVLALAAAATVVSAETNAQRMARGLPPMAPAKRATPVQQKRHKPSAVPAPPPGGGGQCNTGDVMCCNSFQQTTSHGGSPLDMLLGQLGLVGVVAGTNCGLSCDPITAIGTGSGAECQSQPVCCENNDYTGLVNIGCSPININA